MTHSDAEVAEAIRIADKHLAGEAPARRAALAKDIVSAIALHAGRIAFEAIKEAGAKSAENKSANLRIGSALQEK